jgi:conflict system STAND superfamily ATPase
LSARRVSSPASTGGAGTVFEQHVGAYWLAQLLVRAIPPILHDCIITQVHFQTEHLGWRTDDCLVEGRNGAGVTRKLAGQVKRSFTVSVTDEECKNAFLDFWADFKNAAVFSPDRDRFALVALRGTNTLLENFGGLLDCARAARDGAEFERRLKTPGFLATKTVHYCDAIRAIIGEAEGRPMTAADLWAFLRLLHVLSLDLQTSTAQTEAAIKTLLAHTAGGPDPAGAAGVTWNALVVFAASAMMEAKSFRHEDLPGDLRERHAVVGATEQKGLQALRNHSAPVLALIRSTIGSRCHLSRAELVQDVIDQLQDSRVVVITGAAGCGKSAVAKNVVEQLSKDQFAFSFRAEEFTQPHIDITLQQAQIGINAETLRAILAGQDRKLVLIESVERLLEKSTRDAFSDLLRIVAGDASFQLVLTCRDYSADQVRTSFLAAAGITHVVVEVPALTDTDLKEVEAAYPDLARPLAHPPLRPILRNPYLLDKALLISWASERPLPESEREFRSLFWQEIVRADAKPAGGMPLKREAVFEEIAVRRARALSAYVPARDLDAAVIESLRGDSLIASPERTAALVAPAHDVLEDWAILQWIERQHAANEGSFEELSAVIGTHPAVRRSYRKWVAELLDRDPGAAGSLFTAAVGAGTVSAQFRDDTLVALLRAPSSPEFIAKHEAELLANDKALLKRVIHLLRVACVTAPPWANAMMGHGLLLNIPDGPAWPAVLRLVQKNIAKFDTEMLLLLGLIEDWAGGVSVWRPYPKGAIDAAAIGQALLPHFDTYRDDGPGQRIMKIIAKIPRADPARIEAVLRGTQGDEESERTAREFQEMIFEGMDGTAIARDLPDVLIAVAQSYLFCTQEELENEFRGSMLGVELNFGIKENLSHGHFPPSAYRGPWLQLLRYHKARGMDLLISVFNHSADWYAHPRVGDRLEPAFEITLTFADGATRRQWVNGRLWNLYRGTSVAPYVLQSMAMALERWLFELAETKPETLDATLLDMLRRSDSGALTAVAASVAIARPHLAGETLLVLLQSPELIRMDSHRVVNESQAPSGLHEMFPKGRGQDAVFNAERKESDGLPHRKYDLESAIMNLQLGPLASRVHEILDRQRAAVPEAAKRTEQDRMRLLSLGRMDLRQYNVGAVVPAETPDPASSEPPRQRVLLEPKELAPDVQQMVDQNATKFAGVNARIAVLMWGLKVFGHEQGQDPSRWKEVLAQARALNVSDLDEMEMASSGRGPNVVAAVCVRDHWDEMEADDRNWCVEHVCAEVMRDANQWDEMTRIQRHGMSADRPCANVISVLLGKELTGGQRNLVREAFVNALTHPVNEVQWYAVWGIARQLSAIDPALALRCVNALALAATLVDGARAKERKKQYDKRKPTERIEEEAAALIRKQFWKEGGIAADAQEKLDPQDWFGAEATARILATFGETPCDALAIAAYTRAGAMLAEWWEADDDRRRDRKRERRERNHETQTAVSDFVQKFVLRTTSEAAEAILQPILATVDRVSRDIHWFVRGLTIVEDQLQKTEQFWFIWSLFAKRVRSAPWIARLDDRYPSGDELISAIFLGSWWKEDVRHWRSLEGHADHVHRLFDDLPPSSTVLDDYVRFLYHIGEQSLPAAFMRIADKLKSGSADVLLKKRNTAFMLEVLLQRHVYGRPLELKKDRGIRDAVLAILDILVENGSSAAFRMRDDFVTPIAAA